MIVTSKNVYIYYGLQENAIKMAFIVI